MLAVPGWLAYLTVFLATALENVFPPTPSDVMVALAGFLSHHGVTVPLLVFAFAWGGGMVTATGVYLVSRRHGRTFFASPLGQRLLPANAVAAMEREYRRFGAGGLFIARLIPGIRTFVAPFAGLIELTPARALGPIALASALWYAGLTWAGAALGAEWEAIVKFIGHLNAGLAIFGLVVVGGLVIWRLARRPRSSMKPLVAALQTAFQAPADRGRIARLLLEIARDQSSLDAVGLAQVEERLAPLVVDGREPVVEAGVVPRDFAAVSSLCAANYTSLQRQELLRALEALLSSDAALASCRDALRAHATRLLSLDAAQP